jgi:hypothetical protein
MKRELAISELWLIEQPLNSKSRISIICAVSTLIAALAALQNIQHFSTTRDGQIDER